MDLVLPKCFSIRHTEATKPSEFDSGQVQDDPPQRDPCQETAAPHMSRKRVLTRVLVPSPIPTAGHLRRSPGRVRGVVEAAGGDVAGEDKSGLCEVKGGAHVGDG